MAVTDVLETVYKLTGVAQSVPALGSMAVAADALSAAEQKAIASTFGLGAAFEFLSSNPLVALATALAGVTLFLGKAVSAFGEADLVTARLERGMANLGNVFPVADLQEFANELQRTTGISDELIATLGGTAAQFGLTRRQIEQTIPTILDIAAFRGIDPGQVLQTVLRASRGRPQGLVALGIDPSKVRGDITDIGNLISQLNKQFGGTAAAVRQTVPGALQALSESFGNLLEAIGRIFGGTAVGLINTLIRIIDGLTKLVNDFADFLERIGAIAKRPEFGGAAGDLALKGDPEQTGLLGQIAENTRDLKDKLVQRVLGGPGQVAAQAANLRDVAIALRL